MTPILSMLCLLVCQTADAAPRGTLVIAGGGTTTPAIVEAALGSTGGAAARVLIVPQASAREDAGEGSREFWLGQGAASVEVLDLADRPAALDAIGRATLIWMPGGVQSRLMEALCDADLIDAIVDGYRRGATVGGTSAGAAVASATMILSGEPNTLAARSTPRGDGLGLWPGVVVDQHFTQRSRFPRLLALVLDEPELVGVGIDERTAVVVHDGELRVVGDGQVTVIDARRAAIAGEQTRTARNIRLDVLRSGDRMRLE